MRIGELARRAGCGVDTVRYYEREGLLPGPERSQGNYRIYGPAHLERLTFVRNCRALEMSLAEIRTLLALWDGAGQDCAEVAAVLTEHIDHVARRIEQLGQLMEQLVALRQRCRGDTPVARCGILRGLVEGRDVAGGAGEAGEGHLDGPHPGGPGRTPSR
jgi:Cd(II)/Pb(II)-responsive transcriptional regulator